MSREVDIDEKIELWIPAYNSAQKGEMPICPRCNASIDNVQAHDLGKHIGYVVMTCDNCGKSGYFSRVDLTNYKGHITRENAI